MAEIEEVGGRFAIRANKGSLLICSFWNSFCFLPFSSEDLWNRLSRDAVFYNPITGSVGQFQWSRSHTHREYLEALGVQVNLEEVRCGVVVDASWARVGTMIAQRQ